MIKEFFTASPLMAWTVVSMLAVTLAITLLWDKVKWWWLNTWYKLPLMGKVATLARDESGKDEQGWSKPERTLCQDYQKFLMLQDELDFREKKAYLRKATETSRKEMPKLMWALVITLVFVEAMGFSYVLAGYTIPGASENLQQMGAYGIAFMISVMLVAFTHWAGHELYVSSKIKAARREWLEGGQKTDLYGQKVSLDMPQSTDDRLPSYSQMLNRFEHKHASYKITALTAALVAIVAIGATYVRGQVLEQQLIQETLGKTAESSLSLQSNVDGLDMSADGMADLPDADVTQQKQAEDRAVGDEVATKRHGGWGTFIVLAFIFTFLQVLGGLFGFKYGFGSEEGMPAYHAIGKGRYSTYADVRAHYKEIADAAQAMLESLQQRRSPDVKARTRDKTFIDFMREHRASAAEDRKDELTYVTKQTNAERAGDVAMSGLESPVKQILSRPADRDLTVVQVLQLLDSLPDAEAKNNYMDTLPVELEAQVIEVIQQRKTQTTRRAQRGDLFA